ncbi:hypothetical protein [Pseudomonas putida]|uniref:hypothetical protein n=1 Tax=Pseudomonas putida TaxID=303 RepID=UPI0039DFD258
MPTTRKASHENSLIMTRAEFKARLQEAFAPVQVTDYLFDVWLERGFTPRAVALGGLRSNGKACRAVWLKADVEAFLDGLGSLPRLAAPKTVWGAKHRAADQAEA